MKGLGYVQHLDLIPELDRIVHKVSRVISMLSSRAVVIVNSAWWSSTREASPRKEVEAKL